MKRMLVDATHPEETRVAIVEGGRDGSSRLDDLDFALASKPILRGNIYLAKIVRIEPSLQAAFVEYGGNRHGFLPFPEIHPDYFRIPVADRPHDDPSAPEGLNDDGASPALPLPTTDVLSERPAASSMPFVASAESSGVSLPPTSLMGEGDTNVGLITDFGNAAVPPLQGEATALEGAILLPTDEAPLEQPESVGGETERPVRAPRLPHYKIQEVLTRGQVMLVQVVKEERGSKGASLTTYLSLAGRYCVLMPNTERGGGVSRKITGPQDRKRLKEILDQLSLPEGMAVILRTAGLEQNPPEIQRDLDYLMRLWDTIREETLRSSAPAMIYEEANLIKRSIRDLFSPDIAEILVAGEGGYARAREFMEALMPDQVEKIRLYTDPVPLFFRHNVEKQTDSLYSATVQLRSGGSIVINPTEALVAIDVNSGRATRERHIEETALKTNLEAAEEIARQLRLRDLAGLIVIDFIDMEDGRNNLAVERRLKDAMRHDRARVQIGRISIFGLLELSRQRLRPSLHETNFEKCPHCAGLGYVRSVDSAALSVLRALEEEGIKGRSGSLDVRVTTSVALYLLNQKRAAMTDLERRYNLAIFIGQDDSLVPPDYRIERARAGGGSSGSGPAVDTDQILALASHAGGEGDDRTPHVQATDDDSRAFPRTVGAPPVASGRGREDNRRGGREGGRGEGGREGGGRRRPRGEMHRESGAQVPFRREGSTAPSPDINESLNPEGLPGASDRAPGQAGGGDSADPNAANNRRRRGRRGGRRRSGGREGFAREGEQSPPRGEAPREGNAVAVPPVRVTPAATFIPSPPIPSAPMSVYDLDTTPRDRESTSSSLPFSGQNGLVNPPSDQPPKNGWWRRLRGG